MTNDVDRRDGKAPAVELIEDDLDAVVGGAVVVSTKHDTGKRRLLEQTDRAAFDGKGNDLVTEKQKAYQEAETGRFDPAQRK